MPRNHACTPPVVRISPPRITPPRITPPRISPPRLSPPEVNVSQVVTANHPQLPEEKMVRVKREKTTPSPPSPSPQRSQEQESQSPQPAQTRENTGNVASDRIVLPRNTGVVFGQHLAEREQNLPLPEPRQRNAVAKTKVKFSISCVTVSTGSSASGNEDDVADPFAPPATLAPAPAPAPTPTHAQDVTSTLVPDLAPAPVPPRPSWAQRGSLPPLTTSSRHGSNLAESCSPPSSEDYTIDTSTSATTSTTANRSQSTAQTSTISWFPKDTTNRPSLLSVIGPRPFQRKKKRYHDEPIPTKSCRPDPAAALTPADQLKALPSAFSPDGSCPGLSPATIAIPPRVGRLPNRPPADRPPPERPSPPARKGQAENKRPAPPPQQQKPAPDTDKRVKPPNECHVIVCLQPALLSTGSSFCKFHTCAAINVDGTRCDRRVGRPTYDERVPAYCKGGYHTQNGTYARVELEKKRGILIRATQKLQEASDKIWYDKILAIVHPDIYHDVRLKPSDYEELFDPDSDEDEDDAPEENSRHGMSYRKWRNIALTGLTNDKSVRPARAFLSMTHAMSHPKLKKPPVITLTAAQKAAALKAAEFVVDTPAITEPPPVAPKLTYPLSKYIHQRDTVPSVCPPGWLDGYRRNAESHASSLA